MKFYPIELMENEIINLKNQIEEVKKISKDNKYIEACKFVNEIRIIQLESTIDLLINLGSIPIKQI